MHNFVSYINFSPGCTCTKDTGEMHITSFLALSFAFWTVSPVLCEVQDLTCEELASKMAPEIERLGLPHDGLEAGGKPTD